MYLFLDISYLYQIFFQDASTPVMEGIINLHNDIFFILIIILLLVTYIFYYLIKYFYLYLENTKSLIKINHYNYYLKNTLLNNKITHFSNLEIIWTIIPCIILIYIALLSFFLLYGMDEGVYSPVTIKIVAHQWYWTYEYSFYTKNLIRKSLLNLDFFSYDSYMLSYDDLSKGQFRLLEVDNPLILPIWVNLRFLITSEDVLHSWAVPSLGIKCDAVPGRLNQIFCIIKRVGKFYGQCSELCGVNHGFMPIIVISVEPYNYLLWGDYFMLSNLNEKYYYINNG